MSLKVPRPFLLVSLIAELYTCLSLPSSAGYPPMVPTLQPHQAVSPNGTWILNVKPGTKEGAGPALTTLTNAKTGEIAWKRMLPYTFWQCCVNEQGVAGGYAYSKGVMGDQKTPPDSGDMLIRFLDVKGVSIHEETTRRHGGFAMYGPEVYVHRLLLDGGNDRMILVMPNGMLRSYRMNTGTLEGAFVPESKGDASGYGWPDEIRFVPGTRLMLLESNSARGNATETTTKSCIQLIDEGGRTLWAASQQKVFGAEKEWPFPEYRILDPDPSTVADDDADVDPFAGVDPFAEPDENPRPIGPPAPDQVATFGVHFGDTEAKAVFSILDSGGNDGPHDYQVVENSREKWPLPKQPAYEEEPTPPEDFPIVAAKKIAGFQLKSADGKPLTELDAVALGPEETIHALDSGSGRIHVFDRDGKWLHVCDPAGKHSIASAIAVDEKGEVFARISDPYDVEEDKRDPSAGHYLRFSPDGTLQEKPLAPPSSEFSGSIAVQPKAGHLLFHDGFGDKVAVTRRDQYGSRVATLTHRADGQWLDYIQDIACAPDGTIAVRDTSGGDTSGGFTTPFPRLPNHLPAETITIYEADGDPVRTIDFSSYAGLMDIAFDGSHIAATFPYDPPTPLVYLFDSEGTPAGAIRIPELTDRKSVNLCPFIVSGGKAILAVDQKSGMAFRFEIP